ncbi:hypothetical protein CCACVL1_03434 [Corchorus capsularis]|uniref:Uncharacterized protein n=1 Tax=Corchorus capsularis TaxID=210143 RepID=A0A1R3JZH5_COCAP|nr:hypothetical protein CCACVL1_03434 [Corchorus capsularis]
MAKQVIRNSTGERETEVAFEATEMNTKEIENRKITRVEEAIGFGLN